MAGPSVTLVESSVLLDVLTEDPAWGQWSHQALARAGDEGRLVISPITCAEISTGFDAIEELDDAVPASNFEREPLPYEAGLLAGKAFLAYRGRGGQRGRRFPTSTSARLRRCADTDCLLATSLGTARRFPHYSS